MDPNSSTSGTIITFYSYKGGTGRSMSLANTACLLAKRLSKSTKKILLMDWDLEAPGLHRYFAARSEQPENAMRPGVINLLYELRQLLDDNQKLYEDLLAPGGWRVLDAQLSLDKYLVRDVVLGVDLIKAGQFDSQYSQLVAAFDWADFYRRYGGAINVLRELLTAKYAYCLIDSRTGVTDISGICTTLLPEKLVAVFTPNYQSLYGLLGVVDEAIRYRRASDDFRSLSIFPLPSRIELAEKSLREQWRKQYQREFEALFCRVYEIETSEMDLTAYFDEVQLPHMSYYAYGENIAVLEERSDTLSLSRAYREFYQRVIELDEAWDSPGEREKETTRATVNPTEEKYDVFFSYNSKDQAAVQDLATRLEESGVRVYLDSWSVRPGEDYHKAIEKAMAESGTIVVVSGADSLSPWNTEESSAALRLCVQDPEKRVIPVILPGGSPDKLPNFLKALSSVNFRESVDDSEAYNRLLSGIKETTSDRGVRRNRKLESTVMIGQQSSIRSLGTFARRHLYSLALATIAIVGMLVVANYYFVNRPIDSMAVLPFNSISTELEVDKLADDVTDQIINELSQLPNMRIVPRNSVQRFKGREVDTQSAGREFNVRAILQGSITKLDNNSIIINAELIDVRNKRKLWAIQRPVKLSDFDLVPTEIVDSVSNAIGIKLSALEKKKKDAKTLYYKGRNAWNKRTEDDIKDAINDFTEALEIYPLYAPAYAGLADCYNMLGTYGAMDPREAFPRARDAAIKALALDNTLAEAHAALAYATFRGNWNWQDAETEFKRAIDLDYTYVSTHQWYANLLAAQGRFDEAIFETRRAQELDKTSLIINSHLGLIYYFAHRYDESISECQKTVALDPTFFVAHRYLGLAYAQKGMHKEALVEFELAVNASNRSPLIRAEYTYALALSGDTTKVRAELADLIEISKQKYLSAYHLAAIYVALKDTESAFQWLNKAINDRADWLVFLKVDPRFDRLHSDPRFIEILRRINLDK